MSLPIWYLPLSEEFGKALESGVSLDSEKPCRYEMAAILYLLQLPKLVTRLVAPLEMERSFARLLTHPSDLLASVLTESYSRDGFSSGLLIAPSVGIGLIDQKAVTMREYVHSDGSWNFDFARTYGRPSRATKHDHIRPDGKLIRLSDPQHRLIETIRANPEDSIETQAYAGSGKTFVLKEIGSILHDKKCLFLADVESKLWPVQKQFSKEKIHALTFHKLASLLLSRGNPFLEERIKAAANRRISDESVAERLNVSSVGGLNGQQIVRALRPAINKFCLSSDTVISVRHLPSPLLASVSPAQQQLLVAIAHQLWSAMIDLDRQDLAIRVTGWHRLKQIALMGLNIPASYQAVIIDEGHDLISPLVEILDRSPQVVITLGDQFQNLQGRYISHAAKIRHREMTLSLRAGPQIADYLNPLIDVFPDTRVEPFIGNAEKETLTAEYRAEQFPPEPSAILVADEWGVFDWLIRNRHLGAGAAVAHSVDLGTFLEDCLSLYTGLASPQHVKLAAYRSWGELRAGMTWNHAFLRVEDWLEKVGTKFGVSGLHHGAKLDELGGGIPSRHLIVTVAAAKNFELPRVAISEDLYYFDDLRGKREMSRKLALLYTAITRCSGKIFFPSTHHDWINCVMQSRH
ncbi:hypothetical protein [Pseudomonas aeruginosa]|uniref:hypothetical protein n=1 Tax=Pseudomonas aeruginosa TaxID=287 RepID=UPI001F45AB14|nr:hypothetical protein [Pseudomonas aeruginosa]UGX03272.1 hypothetical protein LSG45_11715 [Pseudomonas aeruginosa]